MIISNETNKVFFSAHLKNDYTVFFKQMKTILEQNGIIVESASYKQTGTFDTFEEYDQDRTRSIIGFNLKKVPYMAKNKGNRSTIQNNRPSLYPIFLQYIG